MTMNRTLFADDQGTDRYHVLRLAGHAIRLGVAAAAVRPVFNRN
jgi:hypothetical protein